MRIGAPISSSGLLQADDDDDDIPKPVSHKYTEAQLSDKTHRLSPTLHKKGNTQYCARLFLP